jgi:non-specific serine/threonine protein kinase/serine/threonine-protein kinase
MLYQNQGKYAQAEALAREALKSREKTNTWERYNCESILGASLAGQKEYKQAESLLFSGYEGMRQQESTIPAASRVQVKQAGKWIIQLYQDWGKPEKAAEWRAKLQETTSGPRAQ